MKAEDINNLIEINSKEELKELAKAHGYDDKTTRHIWKINVNGVKKVL